MYLNMHFDLVVTIQEGDIGDIGIILISSIKLSPQHQLKRKIQFYKTSWEKIR